MLLRLLRELLTQAGEGVLCLLLSAFGCFVVRSHALRLREAVLLSSVNLVPSVVKNALAPRVVAAVDFPQARSALSAKLLALRPASLFPSASSALPGAARLVVLAV